MTSERPITTEPASFRDPSGFIYRDADGRLCRQVNPCYLPHFRRLVDGGLYGELVKAGLMVEHEEEAAADGQLLTLRPREIGFISYPYEWSFSMLKEAALLTLEIQKRALAKGMSLKDASAYNVQFEGARPVFIDTLSFEPLTEGKPWVGYGQFCRHFLAPLALMSRVDIRLGRMLAEFIDGVPLDLAARLLPMRTVWNMGLLLHLRMHAKAVTKHQDTHNDATTAKAKAARVSAQGLKNLVEHLQQTVRKQRWSPRGTEWVDYYQANTYTEAMRQEKTRWVLEALQKVAPKTVWDLGANTGLFSRVARDAGANVVAIDIDPGCVERNFLDAVAHDEKGVLPLCMDLTNPSSGLGWAHQERRSLSQRGPADAILALALVHHLAVGNNVPFALIAEWFAQLGRHAIIEFVPKDDPQTQRLLQTREDIFTDYTQENFEAAMARHFRKINSQRISESGRVLYLFEVA